MPERHIQHDESRECSCPVSRFACTFAALVEEPSHGRPLKPYKCSRAPIQLFSRAIHRTQSHGRCDALRSNAIGNNVSPPRWCAHVGSAQCEVRDACIQKPKATCKPQSLEELYVPVVVCGAAPKMNSRKGAQTAGASVKTFCLNSLNEFNRKRKWCQAS
eukprot:1533366-Pleurochrysis_carterae.AAC.6